MRVSSAQELGADFVSRSHAFFGRTAELDQLVSAVPTARPGRPLVRFIAGPAGIGKSALLQRVTSRLARSGALILSSRCRQQGARPFRALEGMLDALARQLSTLPAARVEALVPRDSMLMARSFPALLRALPCPSPHGERLLVQPTEQRNRAFVALRELLRELTAERPVVLALDDMHWLDLDSLSLLRALLRGPSAPAVTLLGTLYPEGEPGLPEQAMSVSELQRLLNASGMPLALKGLDPEAAQLFTEHLLKHDLPSRLDEAATISRGSEGHPRLIEQWVLLLKACPDEPQATSLPAMLEARLSRLRPRALEVATLVSLADGPVPFDVLGHALTIELSEVEAEADALRLARLSRVTQRSDGEHLELAHERVREVMLARLGNADCSTTHAALARAYAVLRPHDEEAIAHHLQLAGAAEKAAEAFARAADRALDALAFARAARLYRRSIALTGPATPRERHARLGDALTSWGRAPEGARAYLAAAGDDSSLAAIELRRRAAELLLVCGHASEGARVGEQLMRDLALPLRHHPLFNALSLGARGLLVRAAGTSFRTRDAHEVPARELLRIDACWSLFVGLLGDDPLRAQHAITLHLQRARAAGEPMRVARGLAGLAIALEMTRGRRARAQELIERAESILEGLDAPHVRGLCQLHAGIRAFHSGHQELAKSKLEQAEQAFHGARTATPWELSVTQFCTLLCHFASGDVPTLRRLAHDWHDEAVLRGDLSSADNLRARVLPLVALLEGDLAKARSWLEQPLQPSPRSRFDMQVYWRELSLVECELFQCSVRGLTRIELLWPQLRRSGLLHVRALHIEAHWLRARATLIALSAGDARASEAQVLADAQELESSDMSGAEALATSLRAGLAAHRGERVMAAHLFREAQRKLAEQGYELLARFAQLRSGLLGKSDEAGRAQRQAELWLIGVGVRRPSEALVVFMPGGL